MLHSNNGIHNKREHEQETIPHHITSELCKHNKKDGTSAFPQNCIAYIHLAMEHTVDAKRVVRAFPGSDSCD